MPDTDRRICLSIFEMKKSIIIYSERPGYMILCQPPNLVPKTERYYITTPAAHELVQQARERHLRISSWGTTLYTLHRFRII